MNENNLYNQSLSRFIQDEHLSNSVFLELLSILDKNALRAVFSGEETRHYQPAKAALEELYGTLKKRYGTPVKKEMNQNI